MLIFYMKKKKEKKDYFLSTDISHTEFYGYLKTKISHVSLKTNKNYFELNPYKIHCCQLLRIFVNL